jgi:hypothetical protein
MRLWELYHENMPDFLREFAAADALLRLKRIGMTCGLEYTGFSLFQDGGSYTRFEHSVGGALIGWHFTGTKDRRWRAFCTISRRRFLPIR